MRPSVVTKAARSDTESQGARAPPKLTADALTHSPWLRCTVAAITAILLCRIFLALATLSAALASIAWTDSRQCAAAGSPAAIRARTPLADEMRALRESGRAVRWRGGTPLRTRSPGEPLAIGSVVAFF